MYKIIALLGLIIGLAACSEKAKRSVQVPDEDFCALIHTNDTVSIEEKLSPFKNRMKDSTGVYVLEEGDVAMISRAWISEHAVQSIDIQYFIFSMDNVGLIALDYLLNAADRGVKVRVLVDDIMVDANPNDLLAFDQHPNIDIKVYNPQLNIGKNWDDQLTGLVTDFKGVNQRMHNKTFIVDNQVAITGGRNIADEYFDYDHEYNFRDRDILLIGKEVKTMQQSFEEFWSHSLSIDVEHLVVLDELEMIDTNILFPYIHQYACNPYNYWPQVRDKVKGIPQAFDSLISNNELVWLDKVQFITDVPGKNENEDLEGGGITTDSLVALVQRAQKSIYIQSPYLVTTEKARNLFQSKTDGGITVSILTNSLCSTDNLDAFNGYQRDREALLNAGVEIFEYKPDAQIRKQIMTGELQNTIDFAPIFGLHAKSMVIDERIVVIGTFNLDPRSANLNTECFVVLESESIAQKMLSLMMLELEEENAWKVTSEFNADSEAEWTKRLNTWWRTIVPKSIL